MPKTRLVVIVAVALVVTFGVVNFYLANELPSARPQVVVGGTDSASGTLSAADTAIAPTPTRVNLTPLPPTVSGVVTNGTVPIAGATVQIQGKAEKFQTDAK